MAVASRTFLLAGVLLLILGGFALLFFLEAGGYGETAALFPRLVASASLLLLALALALRWRGRAEGAGVGPERGMRGSDFRFTIGYDRPVEAGTRLASLSESDQRLIPRGGRGPTPPAGVRTFAARRPRPGPPGRAG